MSCFSRDRLFDDLLISEGRKTKNGSPLLVSGKSIRGSVRFQFYRSSGDSSSGAIKLRISTNGGSSWNAYDEQIGTYKDTDEVH